MPQFLFPTAPAVRMMLHAHPTIPSDVTPEKTFEFDTRILHE